MGLKGIIKFLLQRTFEITIIALLITFIPNLPPHASFKEILSVPTTKPLEGKLALKESLNDVEFWHKGDLVGPECFAIYNGELYTSLYEGDIVKLVGNHIIPVVKFGKPCKGSYEERICGRPLGICFDKSGNLYAADAYYGIFKVNVKTGEKVQLISPNEEIGGKKTKLFNSLVVANNGDIYWTASSTQFTLEDGVFDLLADPSGRLVHYDAKTKKNTVLIDKLAFANGVALADDESFVIVSESARNAIHRYYLQGPAKGQKDIFIDGLPGMPDNINSDGQGGFLVALALAVDKEHPQLFQIISPFPHLRKLIARIFGLSEFMFATLNRVYPNEVSQRAVHYIGHFTSVSGIFSPKRVTILHISKNGEILSSLHNLNKKIAFISEANIYKDSLYLGSPHNDYIARIPLSKIGWDHLVSDRKKRDIPTGESSKTTTKPEAATKTTPTPKQTTQSATTAPTKQTTSPPKQQTTPPPKQQTTPPPKQQTTPPPKQQTTPPPKQQTTPPPKQQTTPPPKQQTTPPPKQQTTPPPKQQTTPPPKQQTTPPPKQQTTPSPKQQTTSPPKQQTPPAKQQTPPQKQEVPPAQKPTTPPPAKDKLSPKQK